MSALRIPDYGHRPHATPTASPLDAYRGRGEVTAAERALLQLVGRLSQRQGFCYASNQYLADELKVSRRHVRRLLATLRDGGYLAITKRRAQTNLLRIKKLPTTVENLAQDPAGGEDTQVPGGRTSKSAPGRTSGSPKELKKILIGGQPDAPGQARLPFNGERTYFNPFRPHHAHDRWQPLQRLSIGFRAGWFLFTSHDGQVRTIAAIEQVEGLARLHLVDDAGPDRPPHVVWIKAEDLKSWTFWR